MTERFTARGGHRVEARIAQMIEEITHALGRSLPPDAYRAVVLMGGYGRGEGGVVERDGEEWPHNNFDFLIVTPRAGGAEAAKQAADRALAPLAERLGIGMDVGAIGEPVLRSSPCRVMWYDLRFGHRPLLGDRELVGSLDRFTVDRIAPWDIRNLLVNRGTLLVINELAFERGLRNAADRTTAMRHVVKAIIGYGDAVLFSRGGYHFSYETRQRRMRALTDVSAELRALYDEAMELRFRARPSVWIDRDLPRWNASLRALLAPVHLEVEALRLGRPDLSWAEYPVAALRHALFDGATNARSLGKRALALRDGAPPAALVDRAARLAWRTTPARDRIPLLFPAVAYDLDAPAYSSVMREALGVTGARATSAMRAYLRAWAVHGDPNFPATLRRLGLELEEERAA